MLQPSGRTAGVQLYESLTQRGYINVGVAGLALSPQGRTFVGDIGIDLERLDAKRTPLCRECLDWSERKTHLAGSIGRALLDHMIAEKWVIQPTNSRVVNFTARGRVQFASAFPPAPAA